MQFAFSLLSRLDHKNYFRKNCILQNATTKVFQSPRLLFSARAAIRVRYLLQKPSELVFHLNLFWAALGYISTTKWDNFGACTAAKLLARFKLWPCMAHKIDGITWPPDW